MPVGVRAARSLCVLLALALAGCAASPQRDAGQSPRTHWLADNLPTAAGGEPVTAPRPNAPVSYPPVFEVKQLRRAKLLNDEEYKKLRDDLTAARERAIARAKAIKPAQAEKDNAVAARTPAAGDQLAATVSN